MHYASSYPASVTSQSCGCMGPQNGDPLCPCAMRNVRIVDGRYVQDLGPAKPQTLTTADWDKAIAAYQGVQTVYK